MPCTCRRPDGIGLPTAAHPSAAVTLLPACGIAVRNAGGFQACVAWARAHLPPRPQEGFFASGGSLLLARCPAERRPHPRLSPCHGCRPFQVLAGVTTWMPSAAHMSLYFCVFALAVALSSPSFLARSCGKRPQHGPMNPCSQGWHVLKSVGRRGGAQSVP